MGLWWWWLGMAARALHADADACTPRDRQRPDLHARFTTHHAGRTVLPNPPCSCPQQLQRPQQPGVHILARQPLAPLSQAAHPGQAASGPPEPGRQHRPPCLLAHRSARARHAPQADMEAVAARCGELTKPWEAVDRAQARAVLDDPLRRQPALDSLVTLVRSPCVLLSHSNALSKVPPAGSVPSWIEALSTAAETGPDRGRPLLCLHLRAPLCPVPVSGAHLGPVSRHQGCMAACRLMAWWCTAMCCVAGAMVLTAAVLVQALDSLDPQIQEAFQALMAQAEDANLHSALAGMSLSAQQP